ncbi:unnamed protein product [Heterotrigona itama]|uniref:Ig-like domain-containing protein n=1 Tax=Heterotrigona itama TaxID=395501 RepID=A0A6V7HET1_9HYME|nr:unnamed protein product [Heterotrigona itama]
MDAVSCLNFIYNLLAYSRGVSPDSPSRGSVLSTTAAAAAAAAATTTTTTTTTATTIPNVFHTNEEWRNEMAVGGAGSSKTTLATAMAVAATGTATATTSVLQQRPRGAVDQDSSQTQSSPSKGRLNFLEGFRSSLRPRSPVRNNSIPVSKNTSGSGSGSCSSSVVVVASSSSNSSSSSSSSSNDNDNNNDNNNNNKQRYNGGSRVRLTADWGKLHAGEELEIFGVDGPGLIVRPLIGKKEEFWIPAASLVPNSSISRAWSFRPRRIDSQRDSAGESVHLPHDDAQNAEENGPPAILTIPCSIRATAGGVARLVLEVRRVDQRALVRWRKEGQRCDIGTGNGRTDRYRLFRTNDSLCLEIAPCLPSDSGVYHCYVQHETGSCSAKIPLRITGTYHRHHRHHRRHRHRHPPPLLSSLCRFNRF